MDEKQSKGSTEVTKGVFPHPTGRPQQRKGGRPQVVATRLSMPEVEYLDRVRGALTRSEYIRWLLVTDRKNRGL